MHDRIEDYRLPSEFRSLVSRRDRKLRMRCTGSAHPCDDAAGKRSKCPDRCSALMREADCCGARRRTSRLARPVLHFNQLTFAGTIRGSKLNTFGLRGSIVALTQWVFLEPNVSTRVKLVSTPPPVERL